MKSLYTQKKPTPTRQIAIIVGKCQYMLDDLYFHHGYIPKLQRERDMTKYLEWLYKDGELTNRDLLTKLKAFEKKLEAQYGKENNV